MTEVGRCHSYQPSPDRATRLLPRPYAWPVIAGDLSCPRGDADQSGAAGGGLQVRAVPSPTASRRVTSRPSKEPSVSASEMNQTEPNADAGLMWRTAASLTWLLRTHVPVLASLPGHGQWPPVAARLDAGLHPPRRPGATWSPALTSHLTAVRCSLASAAAAVALPSQSAAACSPSATSDIAV
jgi:hypothetical protein